MSYFGKIVNLKQDREKLGIVQGIYISDNYQQEWEIRFIDDNAELGDESFKESELIVCRNQDPSDYPCTIADTIRDRREIMNCQPRFELKDNVYWKFYQDFIPVTITGITWANDKIQYVIKSRNDLFDGFEVDESELKSCFERNPC